MTGQSGLLTRISLIESLSQEFIARTEDQFGMRFCLVLKFHKVKVTQSCPTLCGPMDCTVHGIPQARVLEWVAYPSSVDLPDPGIELGSPALQGILY